MNAAELLKRIRTESGPAVIDVRTGFEYWSGHIPGAIHAPTWKIFFRIASLPGDREKELVVTCEHGPRAGLAAKLLGLYGYRRVQLLDGHMAGWRRSGYPLRKQD